MTVGINVEESSFLAAPEDVRAKVADTLRKGLVNDEDCGIVRRLGGSGLTDKPAIMEYLQDRLPGSDLMLMTAGKAADQLVRSGQADMNRVNSWELKGGFVERVVALEWRQEAKEIAQGLSWAAEATQKEFATPGQVADLSEWELVGWAIVHAKDASDTGNLETGAAITRLAEMLAVQPGQNRETPAAVLTKALSLTPNLR